MYDRARARARHIARGAVARGHCSGRRADDGAGQQATVAAPAPPPERAPSTATADAPAMTLAEALAYARTRHPRLRLAHARIRAAASAAAVPRAQWLPSVGATAQLFLNTTNNSTASAIGSPVVDLPRVGATAITAAPDWRPAASTLVAVGVRQELFDFGRIAAQTAAADAEREVERRRADADRLTVELAVQETFYAVHAARAVLEAAEQSFARARAHRDMVRAWVERELRPRVDLERAEALLARAEVGQIRARAGLAAAQTVFAAAVGVAAPMLDAAGPEPEPGDVPSLAAAMRRAAERDPAIREILARLALQERRIRAVEAEALPRVLLTGAVSSRAGGATPSNGPEAAFDGWLPVVPNWGVGVVVNWPLLDPTILARREATRRGVDVLRGEVALARREQAAAVQQAYVDIIAARASLPALARAVQAAQANQRQAEARFQRGLGTSLEVTDAEVMRTEAEIQLALGRFALARARARLGRAIAEGM